MPKTSETKPAIVIQDVVKEFKLKHSQSLKEAFTSIFKKTKPSGRDFRALDGVSFEVPEGESLAVLGRNGSGKSTTLKLISGVLLPDEGWVRTRGRVAGLLEVGAGFHPDLTGRDNIYLNAAILGMSRAETDARFEEIVEFSGIERKFLDTEVKRYSSGMKSRLGFAVAVHTNFDVLLVDEVLSVGDAAFRAKCTERILELRDQNKTMFVVSHSISTVKKLCTRGVVLDKGKIIFDGPIDEAAKYVQPPKAKKPRAKPTPVEDTSEFNVAPELKYLFSDSAQNLGQPLADPVSIIENGGGVVQHFERGIAASSNALKVVQIVRRGHFYNAYLKSGGPAGPWGFPVSRRQGPTPPSTELSMRFQNGIAHYNGDVSTPVEFIPAPLDAAQPK